MQIRDKKVEGNPVGIVRKVDKLGRICLPKEYAKLLKIDPYTEVEILMFDDETLLIQRYRGADEDYAEYRDDNKKNLCKAKTTGEEKR